jgi:Putative adhesin
MLTACSASLAPFVTTVGLLKPGTTLAIRAGTATVNAFQPAAGQRRDLFTIAATALPKTTPPPPPRLRLSALGLAVRAPGPLGSLLVRVPDGVNLVVESQHGDVNVTDISGNARILAQSGNVDIKVPSYAQAAVGVGNLSVMMGALDWPGTLRFSTQRGDVQVWISAKAAFSVHLHTDEGVLFTDFALQGTSTGRSETIDGSVNGGSAQRIDVETSAGAIRLLRLQPQP